MYKIISVILLLCLYLVLSSSTSSKTATGTMMVTATVPVKVVPTHIFLPNNTSIIKDLPIGTKVTTVTTGHITTITVIY
jgi:YbbR domain-containing protein